MRSTVLALTAVALASFAGASPALATVVWNEPVDGDFSDNYLAPTPVALSPGLNQVLGFIAGEDDIGGFDRDYYTFTIPAGYQLSEITLDSYISDDFQAFLGISLGSQFSVAPTTAGISDPLGWTLFGNSLLGQNLLPVMGQNGQGFVAPLGPGAYTIWTQQIGPATEYVFNFVVVPAPTTAAAFALPVLAAFGRRRARVRTLAS